MIKGEVFAHFLRILLHSYIQPLLEMILQLPFTTTARTTTYTNANITNLTKVIEEILSLPADNPLQPSRDKFMLSLHEA
jgi:hypothetical protein